MYLSQLEILGFKSFPEKTTLEFDGDITAVVGPNGCGKTNILDSIRWVLGEQRSSALRSSKMEEVIFNGTAQLKPMGLAEVNLTIKNNRGILPVEYDEIVITRRLYRSGESEYLLNKAQCRLRDIMELFYDTGMGPHAYSVIQQGMVDAILSDKAEDRRSLFEEAAGVTKYKHRKKEAIAKLENTGADLLRLGDIIAEIEKQVNQLKRQAARARQYGRLKEELKSIELALAANLLSETQRKFEELQGKRSGLQFEIEALNADFEKREVGLHGARLRVTELEHRAAEERQKIADLSTKAADIESEIKLNKHRAGTAAADIENSKREIEALNKRKDSLDASIEENRQRLIELSGHRKSIESQSASLEQALAERIKELEPCETAVNEIRKRNSVTAQKISALRAEASSVLEMKQNVELKLEALERDSESIDRARSDQQEGLTALEKRYLASESEIKGDRDSLQSKSGEISRIENSLNQKREAISSVKAELSGLLAKQEMLSQLVESGEGSSNGARTLVAWGARPAGMLLPLAEVLIVPEQYRKAIAAALGDLSELIPLRTLPDARAAVGYLDSCDGGRASFLVMERLELASLVSERPGRSDGFIGFADEIIGYPDDYRLAVNLLLGRVAVFESLDSALQAGDRWREFTLVDLEGFVVQPSAVVAGGRMAATALGRKQDLALVQSQIAETESRVRAAESEFSEILKLLQAARDEYLDLEKKARRLEEEKRKIEAELSQLKFDFRERQARYASAREQAAGISGEISGYVQRNENIRRELEILERESQAGSEELERASAELVVLRETVSGLESKLTEARIKAIEHDGLVKKVESDIAHGRELFSEAEKMIASHAAAISNAENSARTSIAQNEELETKLYDIFARRRDLQSGLHEVEDSITEFMSETQKIGDELSHQRKERDKLVADLHALEMEFAELESRRESIIERLRMEFNVSSLEPAPLPEGKTADDLRSQGEALRLRLHRMDPVNLMAAEDYEREKDRLEFLVRQRDDLLQAESSLKEAIGRINATAETRFRETFAKIQNNYQDVFSTLFEGGEARLELEDESDPLESPIRILARPGGKRLLSVTQLSGGERALTAISLLFGIYLVKPSPFCILDEVDAPLDDANLVRFLKLIKNFSESTQFIVITHNKMTMEASDVLYGVTMETPGVSKVVSVKFGGNGN